MTSDESAALTYASYLALDDVLGAQRPRSEEHDELLFIVIHQVYELWFKQLLHELAGLQRALERGDSAMALHLMRRVRTILKTAVGQIDILETMTPRSFASFRDRLASASGFQSAQFREFEAVLGRRDPLVLEHHPVGQRERIAAAMARPDLFDSFLGYLAASGHAVPAAALERDVSAPREPDEQVQATLLEVYGADQIAAQMCESLVDIDEGVQEWRYRHVKMVERTIGSKPGTGGSSGVGYLRETLFHPAFPDLWQVRAQF